MSLPAQTASRLPDDGAESRAGARVAAAVELLAGWAHLDLIGAVAELSLAEVEAALTRLERDGLLREATPAILTAAGLRTGPLAALPASARGEMHARAAAELARRGASKPEICEHLLHAPGQGSATNAAILRACAAEESLAGRSAAASELLQRALREPPADEDRPALLLELALAMIADGQHEHARQAALQARQGAGALAQQAAVEIALFRAQVGLGEVDRALTRLLAEIERIEPQDADLALQMECELLGVAAIDPRILQAGLRRHRERAVDESLPTAAAYLLAAGQVLAMGGGSTAAEAVALAQRGLQANAAQIESPDLVIRTVWLLFRADAREQALELISRARERRPPGAMTAALDALEGLIRTRWGPVRAAVDQLAGALALARARRSVTASSAAIAFLAIALLESDQTRELERLLAEHDPAVEPGNAFAAVLQVVRGRLRLQAGRPREALDDLLSVERRKVSLGLLNPAGFHHMEPAVDALMRLGQQRRAARLARLNLQRAERWGAPVTLALARGALARCLPPEPAAEQIAQALEPLARMPASVAGAQLMLDCGRALIAAGRPADARVRLREALDGAARVGAERLRRESDAALRSLGARPRRAHSHGVPSLTAAERRVADLAATGLANREIAERLHLSVRTVENHLRSVYGKLQCDRAGLAQALREDGE